ncbi:fucose isomerase [Paenibacillus agaridevorans]|uniref:Fucose isomerase n=1 Tax=Paenibacillus agaridevorans TaxID=171404 RepID=A0A2R5F6R8_9BACL|nr:RbsD/FucU domain-containing protein [Paenibacillus agaridevorans]GBG12321.1 fucose isomerase [Paenibacillus agaridevorans]
MLKGIPAILPPELLKVLMEMGHSDEIVLADGNFPGASHAQRLIRCDGHGIPALLDAMLQLLPLDQYVEKPAGLMAVMPGDATQTPIWEEYREIIRAREGLDEPFEEIERFSFYERAKRAYAIVATGESALYANLILKKGVVKPDNAE